MADELISAGRDDIVHLAGCPADEAPQVPCLRIDHLTCHATSSI